MPRRWERRGQAERWWEGEWSGKREMGVVGVGGRGRGREWSRKRYKIERGKRAMRQTEK